MHETFYQFPLSSQKDKPCQEKSSPTAHIKDFAVYKLTLPRNLDEASSSLGIRFKFSTYAREEIKKRLNEAIRKRLNQLAKIISTKLDRWRQHFFVEALGGILAA